MQDNRYTCHDINIVLYQFYKNHQNFLKFLKNRSQYHIKIVNKMYFRIRTQRIFGRLFTYI